MSGAGSVADTWCAEARELLSMADAWFEVYWRELSHGCYDEATPIRLWSEVHRAEAWRMEARARAVRACRVWRATRKAFRESEEVWILTQEAEVEREMDSNRAEVIAAVIAAEAARDVMLDAARKVAELTAALCAMREAERKVTEAEDASRFARMARVAV